MPKQSKENTGATSRKWRWMGWSLVVLLGLGAGAVTVVAKMPLASAAAYVGAAVPADVTLTGTVWNGVIDTRAHRLTWQGRGWLTLMARGWVADWQITGPETSLVGQWVLRRETAILAPVTGQMGWALVDAAMPGLEIACNTTAEVDLGIVTLTPTRRHATGKVQLAAGTCARTDGTVKDVPMPALLADIVTTPEGVGIAVTRVEAPDVPLGNLLITPDERLRVTVHAAGAAMVPGLPVSGDSQIELPLALFAP